MTARRLRASLKGWGGVGAMALALVVTTVFALLLPLNTARGEGGAGIGGQGVARATQAKADACTDSTAQDKSPAPSGDESGDTISAIKERGYLSVGVDQNSYRWGYRDPNSTKKSSDLEGFDIDLAHEIAKEILGSPTAVRFHAIPTNQRVPAIKNGQVDMVVRTMTINCARLKDVAFSAPTSSPASRYWPRRRRPSRATTRHWRSSGSAPRRDPRPTRSWPPTRRWASSPPPPTSPPPCRTNSTAW